MPKCFLSFSISCNSFVFAIVKIYLLHRITELPKHKNLWRTSEITKSRSKERSVSFPKQQKVVPKGAQRKFSAQNSFQRECKAYYEK